MKPLAKKTNLKNQQRLMAAYRNFRDCLPTLNSNPGDRYSGPRLMRGTCSRVAPFDNDVALAVTIDIVTASGRKASVIVGLTGRTPTLSSRMIGNYLELRVYLSEGIWFADPDCPVVSWQRLPTNGLFGPVAGASNPVRAK